MFAKSHEITSLIPSDRWEQNYSISDLQIYTIIPAALLHRDLIFKHFSVSSWLSNSL